MAGHERSDYHLTGYIEGLHACGAGEPHAFPKHWQLYIDANAGQRMAMRLAWELGYRRGLRRIEGEKPVAPLPL